MKKLFMMAVLICTTQIMSAQHNKKAHKAMDLAPEEMASLQTKKMTLALDLSESQQDDIYPILLENAKLRKAHMVERKAKRESGESTKPTKEERLTRTNAMLDRKIEVKAQMKKILDAEQYAKWEKIQAKRQEKMKAKGKKKHANKKA